MANNKIYITKTSQETAAIGQTLGSRIRAATAGGGQKQTPRIVCLYGPLGAGKTTFTQGFAAGLGITTRLLSPTFIIVRRYDLPSLTGFFYHMDLYRVENKNDMESLGLAEYFADTKSCVVIEWADRLGSLVPESRIDVHFALFERDHHSLRIEEHI